MLALGAVALPCCHRGSRLAPQGARPVPAQQGAATRVRMQGCWFCDCCRCWRVSAGRPGEQAAGRGRCPGEGTRVSVDSTLLAGRGAQDGGFEENWEPKPEAALCRSVRPAAAAARGGRAWHRWPGRLGAGSTQPANGSCWGQFRKRAALPGPACLGPGGGKRRQAPQHPHPMCRVGAPTNALPAVPRATGPGAGWEGCRKRPHPNPGAAAGCAARGRAPAGWLAEVPAAPTPAFPQGPHALLRQVRSSRVWGDTGTRDAAGRGLTHTWVCSCCRVATSPPGMRLPFSVLACSAHLPALSAGSL